MARLTFREFAGFLFVAALLSGRQAFAQVTSGEGHPGGYYGHGTFGDTHPELRDPYLYPVGGSYYPITGSAWSYHPSPFYYSHGMFTYTPWAGGASGSQPYGPTQGTVVQLDPWYVRNQPWWVRHPTDPLSMFYRARMEAIRKKAQPPEPPAKAQAPAARGPIEPAAGQAPAAPPRPATKPPDPVGRELFLVGIGDELLKKGQMEAAEAAYARAVAESPGSPVAPFALAHARIALGKIPEAAAGLREGFARNPEWGREGLDLSALLPKDGQALEECLRKAAEAGPDGRLVRAYVRFSTKAYGSALDEVSMIREEPAAQRIEASIRAIQEKAREPKPADAPAPAPNPAKAPPADPRPFGSPP